MRQFVALILTLITAAGCHRSPEPLFYVLQPLPTIRPLPLNPIHSFIEIEEVSLPAYVNRLSLVIQYAPNQVFVDDHHLWAEGLNKNITRVIQTNLSFLMPNAVIQRSPWLPLPLKPNYRLHLTIVRFTLDNLGSADLLAEYIIYHEGALIKKRQAAYHQQALPLSYETQVAAMNKNLTQLSYDIARNFSH